MNKKLIITTIALGIAVITGCKTVPTVEKSATLGSAVGVTTAYVLNNQVNVPDDVRNNIIAITSEVDKCIPATNSTFTATWTPIAEKYLNSLKDKSGKLLPEAVKTRVLKDFSYITSMLDWYVEKKGMKQYQDCIDAFVHSFTEAFLTKFKPVNVMSAGSEAETLDEDVLEFFKSYKK